MVMEEKEKQDRKILQDYYDNLSEKSLHLLDKQISWASSVEEHSITFSQFLVSICAGLLAIFFSVKDFNNLIINHSIFNWAVLIYSISFLLYIIYSKEKIDHDSSLLTKGYKQSEIDFKNSYDVLERQFKNGINIDTFYKEIEELSKNNKEKISKIDKTPNYFLEFFTFCFMSSLWLLFFSTQNMQICYLYIGLVIIFIITNNQYQLVYKLIYFYSKFLNKIFPTRDI
jgi:hypothetical protein